MDNQDKPVVKLVGNDGNAFAIVGVCKRAARKAGWSKDKIQEFTDKMYWGDYNNILTVAMEYFDVQ